jgi:hypothetical protein
MKPAPEGIREVVEQLDRIDAGFNVDGESTHFLSVEEAAGPLLAIRGNREGLIHLAKQILQIATAGVEGSHYHLDQAGMADRCDMKVAFVLARAEWDSHAGH